MSDGLSVTYGGFALTGTDAYGVTWHTTSPIQGWDGSPASTLQLTQKPRGAGAFIGARPQYTARTVVLEGFIDAPNEDALQGAIDRLVAAVPLTAQKLVITRGSTTRTATCYRQDEVLVSDVTDSVAAFSIQVSAPDPRKLGSKLTDSVGLAAITGGLTIPFTVPFTIGAASTSGDLSLLNEGIVNGPLSMKLKGPITGPVITHVGPGGLARSISLPSLALGANEYITIGDIDTQYVLAQGATPRDQYLSSRQWFAFEPGDNTFQLSAASGTSAAELTVTAYSAW